MTDPWAAYPAVTTGTNTVALPPDPWGAFPLADQAPPQMTGAMREPALVGSNLAAGAAGLGDSIIRGLFANPIAHENFGILNPKMAPLTAGAQSAGIVDRPDLTPQGAGETYLAAGARGVGAALPLLPLTGPMGLVQGAGAGAGAQAGADLMPDHPVAGGVIGSLVGGGTAGGAASLAQRGINAARGVTTPLTGAYDRLGIPTDLAGDVTENPLLQRIQAFSSQAPLGGKVTAAATKSVDAFGNAVEGTASLLGNSRTAQQAGEALQTEARNWRDTVFPAQQTAAWDPVNKAIPWTAAVRPDEYRTALGALASKMKGLPETKKVLLSSRSQGLLDAINSDVPAGAGMSWKEAQNLRSVIGAIRGVPEIADSIGDKELGRLYGALSSDMRTTATNYKAADAFDAANKVSTEGFAFQRNVLGKIIKANNPLQESVTPEQAADNVLNSGDTTLQALRAQLPNGANELAAYKLRDMALARAGKQGTAGETISPTTYLTDYNNLRMRAPAGEKALFRTDPKVSQMMDDLASVAGRMRETTEHVNTSRTGPYLTTKAMLEAPGHAFEGGVAGGLGGGPIGVLAGALGGAAAPFVPGLLGGALTATPWMTRLMATPASSIPRALAYPLRGVTGLTQQPILPVPDYR